MNFNSLHSHLTRISLLGLLATCLWGCRTPATPSPSEQPAQQEDQPAWRRQAGPQQDAEIPFAPTTFAFDHFVVQEDISLEHIWLVLHPVLGWLTNQARGEEAELGYIALMNELEPLASGYDSRTRMEVSFLLETGADGVAHEAMGIRLWRQIDERAPTLSVVLWQDPETMTLSSMQLWAHPDVSGAASSAIITHTDALILPGIVSVKALEDGLARATGDTAHVASLLPLLQTMLWTQFSGAAYLETPLRPERALSPAGLHAGLKPALGLTVRDREIDEVLPDTSFLPYLDVDGMFEGR